MASKEASPFLPQDSNKGSEAVVASDLRLRRAQNGVSDQTMSPQGTSFGRSILGCPHPTRRNTTSIFTRFENSWYYESMGLLLSAAALIAITVTLVKHDRQRLPDWSWVSFNTLISILSTISKMAALYGATSALSQMKWIWFAENDHDLVDFRTFDEGSRGLPGAFFLIWKLRASQLPALAALAIVLGAAADPFAQQLVRLYEKEYAGLPQIAWVSRSTIHTALGPYISSASPTIDLNFAANIITALYQPTQETLVLPRFFCPTGNCTWAPFTTLGFCPSCVSVPLNKDCAPYNESALAADRDCVLSFPEPSSLSLNFDHVDPYEDTNPDYMVVSSTTANESIVHSANTTWPGTIFQAIRAVVDPYSIAGGENRNVLTNNTRFLGTECTLSLCVLSMRASVSSGVYNETVLKTWTQYELSSSFDVVLMPPWGPDDGMQTGQMFTLPWKTDLTMKGSTFLGDQLLGSITLYDRNTAFMPPTNEVQAMFYADFVGTTCPTPEDNVACTFRALGAAATKAIRDAPYLANGTGTPWIEWGTENLTGTFIRVEWPWFALPIVLWSLSCLTVVIAATKRTAAPIWKDDPLPLAFLYRDDMVRSPRQSILDHVTIGNDIKVRLINDNGEMKLSERNSVQPR